MRDEYSEGISKARGVERRQRRADSSTLRTPYTRPHSRSVVSGARGKSAPVCLARVTTAGMETEAKPKRWLHKCR